MLIDPCQLRAFALLLSKPAGNLSSDRISLSSYISYTYISATVAGKEALRLIKKLKVNTDAKQRILIGFVMDSLSATAFKYEKGKFKNRLGVNITSRLLSIKWIKIAGQEVYNAKLKADAGKSENHPPARAPIPEPCDELGFSG